MHVFNVFIKVKKHVFFYLQINVFSIYAEDPARVCARVVTADSYALTLYQSIHATFYATAYEADAYMFYRCFFCFFCLFFFCFFRPSKI